MNDFLRSCLLLFMLLNPFLVILYLIDMVKKLDSGTFASVLWQAGLFSSLVFIAFALLGDAVFADVFQSEFASFQIFGGIIFLIIGVQFVLRGVDSIETLRGESNFPAGAVAMPVMIGPGTISASVVIGKRLEPLAAVAAVLLSIGFSVLIMSLLKVIHDRVSSGQEEFVRRYTEIAGRIMALYIGTVSIDMIMQGVRAWAAKF